MRAWLQWVIRGFDAWLSRQYEIFVFCEAADCILRLQLTRAGEPVHLPGREIRVGDPVLRLHLWNEHIPQMAAEGPDLAWAAHAGRLFLGSLHRVGRVMAADERFRGVKAVGGTTILIEQADRPAGRNFMEGLGFSIVPCRNRLGRFGEFWENFYTWGLMWAFNAPSLRHRRFAGLHRVDAWMAAEDFIGRFGMDGTAIEVVHDYDREYAGG